MVRGARLKAELTQKELAEKHREGDAKVLPHHISEMEYGKRPISKKMAHSLAKVLDVNYKVFPLRTHRVKGLLFCDFPKNEISFICYI